MSEPLPNPVRVIVIGASTVNWTSYMGGPRFGLGLPAGNRVGAPVGGPASGGAGDLGAVRTCEPHVAHLGA